MTSAQPERLAVKPERCRVRVRDRDGELEMTHRLQHWSAGLFPLFWLIGWSVGCVMLIHQVLINPGLMTILFAVPFLAAWVFVFCFLVYLFFGREHLRLAPEGLQYESTALVRLQYRAIPLAELKHVQATTAGACRGGLVLGIRKRFAAVSPICYPGAAPGIR
jgi:hypothetical protein